MRIENLLVAIDLERQSKMALLRAMQLADQFEATLHVLHVTRRSPQDNTTDAGPALKHEIAAELHDVIREHSASTYFDLVVHIENHGRVSERITEHARTLHADLVVLGRSERANVLPGSVLLTTGQVLANASVPVLVVTQPVTDNYRDILLEAEMAQSPAGLLTLISALGPDTRLTLLVSTDTETMNLGVLAGFFSKVRRRKQEAYIQKLREHIREFGFDENLVLVELVPDDYESALISRLGDAHIDLIGLTRLDKRLRHMESGRHMIGALQTAACDILFEPR